MKITLKQAREIFKDAAESPIEILIEELRTDDKFLKDRAEEAKQEALRCLAMDDDELKEVIERAFCDEGGILIGNC